MGDIFYALLQMRKPISIAPFIMLCRAMLMPECQQGRHEGATRARTARYCIRGFSLDGDKTGAASARGGAAERRDVGLMMTSLFLFDAYRPREHDAIETRAGFEARSYSLPRLISARCC